MAEWPKIGHQGQKYVWNALNASHSETSQGQHATGTGKLVRTEGNIEKFLRLYIYTHIYSPVLKPPLISFSFFKHTSAYSIEHKESWYKSKPALKVWALEANP